MMKSKKSLLGFFARWVLDLPYIGKRLAVLITVWQKAKYDTKKQRKTKEPLSRVADSPDSH
jgi:hypothetical protein